MITRQEAAEARRHHIRQLADRPSQRRCAEATNAPSRPAFRSRFEVRDATQGGGVGFTGYASVYETPYNMWDDFGPYTEVVSAGAAANSLARADLDVPLVLGHDQLRRMARTTTGTLALSEDDIGLRVDADGMDPADADVAYIVPKLRAELIDEMSFAFRIVRGTWSPDYMEFRIIEVDIHRGDVAIVGWGANPNTTGSLRADLRSLLRGASDDDVRAALAGRFTLTPPAAPVVTHARAAEPLHEPLTLITV